MIHHYYSKAHRRRIGVVFAYDADAQIYFDAASITDKTEKDAANTLIVGLKKSANWASGNAWDRGKGWYFISPTSMAAALINAKTPGTFDLTAVNTPTHSSNGIDFNGTNQYLRTGIIPSNDLLLDNMSLGYYSRDNVLDEVACEIGSENASAQKQIMLLEYNDTFETAAHLGAAAQAAFFDVDDSRGYVVGSRISSTLVSISRNEVELATNTDAQTGALSTVEFYIGARNNNGSADLFSTKQMSFAHIAEGFTEAEILTLYNLVQAYQTNVISGGRNV